MPPAEDVSLWTYQAQVLRVIDGDSLEVRLDTGFRYYGDKTVRLLGVDTNEIHNVAHNSDEYARGMRQKEFVEAWLQEAEDAYNGRFPLLVETKKAGKYGRYLATVYRRSDGEELNERLLNEFDGVEYEG